MQLGISHDRKEEDLLAKAAWFQSLTLEERMEMLCQFTDLALENNPKLAEGSDDPPPSERVRVVSLPRR